MIQLLTDYPLDELETLEQPVIPVGHDGTMTMFREATAPDYPEVKWVSREWCSPAADRAAKLAASGFKVVDP
jgi:hypothetical protein